ncbi:Clp protease N-terminal domain-containing protein [Streptomyces sp. NPDC002055]|uniref:Clp protease N-terminal domain-containing protein n=1 Tax=Streptomyces sp. NPDC002055 TaxID=3154534 RepID=UPI00331A7DAD
MFERFTRQARTVVVQAQQEARSLGHTDIGTEHLLLGVLAQDGPPVADTLRRRGITAPACRSAVETVLGRGNAPAADGADDAEVLQALGIDLDEVRSRAERTFGPGALDAPAAEPVPRSRRLLPFPLGRRRNRDGGRGGHIPFAPRARRALQRSLREAVDMKSRHIGVEHLLLGLLDPADKLTSEVLRRLGTEPGTVRADVLADLARAA